MSVAGMATPVKKKRTKNVTISKPFIYGSVAFWKGKQAEKEKSHKWTVYLRGVNNEDMSYFIKKVAFQLHPSFKNPLRIVEEPPFEVSEVGWGEFQVGLKVYFHEEASERPVDLHHQLRLFPDHPQQPNVKVPVISEQYDEFVFVEPTETFHTMLNSGPLAYIKEHPLNEFWNTQAFFAEERKELQALATAQQTIQKQIADAKAQIAALQGEIVEMNKKKRPRT